jgi:hypothetical protein
MVLARGSDKVKGLERVLGGTPPMASLKRSRAELQRHVAEHFKTQRRARDEMARLAEPFRELAFSHIPKNDPKLKRSIQAVRTAYARRSRRRLKPPKREKFEPRVTVGSNSWFKAPPYDTEWRYAPSLSLANVNAAAGTYDLAVQSIGEGSGEGAAGMGIWFFAPADDSWQRFAALLDYSDDWWDTAMGYVAHNNLRTRLWVWGDSEQDWVHKEDVSPQWSDGVGWFESHGNDPQGDSGRISLQVFFPVKANQWYIGWVWSDAWVYANSGLWGFADSTIKFAASVPFVVFGSL